MTKTDAYKLRIKNDQHYRRMYVEPKYFTQFLTDKSSTPRAFLIEKCWIFNEIVRIYLSALKLDVKISHYQVILNVGISELAADFEYQYRILRKISRECGIYKEIKGEIEKEELHILYKHITPSVKSGRVSISTEKVDALGKLISDSAFHLYVLMRAHSSKPHKEGGYCDMKVETMAKLLNKNRSNIYRNKKELEKAGLIETLYTAVDNIDGKFKKFSRYVVY